MRVVTLSNGMRLLARQNDASEIVAITCLVRAGLPDESEEQAGLAALTAEALLRGTTTRPGRRLGEAVLQAGGNLTVTPGFDFTEISVVTTREQFEAALRLMGEVIAHPALTPDGVAEARKVLLQRVLMRQDNFVESTYDRVLAQMYARSPYGRPLYGYPETRDGLTAADVRKFWKNHYVQNRMVASVVGNVDPDRALLLARRAFEDIPFNPEALTHPPARDTLPRPRVEMFRHDGPEARRLRAQVMVGFLTPGATRANYSAYELLDALLGGGKRARLFAGIREKYNVGYQLGSFYQPLQFQSHLVGFVVHPVYRQVPGKEAWENVVEQVRGHLLAQYRQLAVAGPTDEELARAKAYVIGRSALRQERTRDQSLRLAWNEAMGLGWDFDQHLAARVQSLTKEQIQTVAKQSLTNYALVVAMPDPPTQ